MKEKTILSFIDTLNAIKGSRMTISAYCEQNGINRQLIYQKMANIKQNVDNSTELYNEVASLYNSIVNPDIETKVALVPTKSVVIEKSVEALKEVKAKMEETRTGSYDDESKSKLTVIRDENGKIKEYQVNVPVKDKPAFRATISREEAEILHGLYAAYGGNITARNVSKEFSRFSLSEVKKLFRAFGITKDALWAPQHLAEELTVEELASYRMNVKEKAAFKYADARMERDFNTEIKKLTSRINYLEDRNTILSTMLGSLDSVEPLHLEKPAPTREYNNILILHLSDFHIGAKVESGSIYQNNWTTEDVKNRLKEILKRITTLGNFDKLIINILGDNIDGFDQQTARRDHYMPQGMDNIQQCKAYLHIMTWFVGSLLGTGQFNDLELYSVKGGNHDGDISWVLNTALFHTLCEQHFNYVTKAEVFDTYFGHYKVKNHDYVICHGKDAKFMKKGMPLNLDDKNKIMIYDWLASQGINGKNVHIIKGDLHTENFNSSYRLDYRNVLSLFGASDYSNYNFTRNQCGVSYDMFIGDNLVRGAFEIK